MPFFTFNTSVPAANDDPSVDQPDMQINNVSTNAIIAVDHYSFNDNSGGLHKQVTLPTEAKPTTVAGQAALYSTTSGQSQLFATSEAGPTGNQAYQLTRFIDADFVSFGQFVAGTVSGTYSMTTGWTFLPGGLLFQYGQVIRAAGISPSTITVTFPVVFSSTSVIVTVTPICRSSGTSDNNTASIVQNSVGTTTFQVNFQTSTAEYRGFTWTAIGI